VTSSGLISGSLFGGTLLEEVATFLKFLPAIFVLQKFTSEEVRDRILASCNIFNFKIKKILNIDCHLAKMCFDAIFSTSFSKIYFADLQSMRMRNF
jgi:hypothetical protein